MSDVRVRAVATKADLDRFVAVAWTVQGGSANWIPPLRKDVKTLLSPTHPVWGRAERELFLAERDGRVVGRIAAIMDTAFIEFQGELAGAWGFFECEKDAEAASALFDAAREWCQARGLTHMRGPFNPSTNYEIGLLVEGFDLPPTIMMPYNPPWYPALVEDCGMVKEKDLLAFAFPRHPVIPEGLLTISRRLREKGEVTIRHAERKNLKAEVALMCSLYEAAWRENWCFTPMSAGEVDLMAESLLPIVDEDLAFFLYVQGQPAGVGLILPDVNPLLKRLDGAIGLTGVFKYLRYKHEIRGARALLFGVKPEYKQMGLPLVLLDYMLEIREKKPQYEYLECGWNLEDNDAINMLLTDFGGRATKRYRIYRQDL